MNELGRKDPAWCRQYIRDRVNIDPETNCWDWILGTVEGYGNGFTNRRQRAHRISYAAFQDIDAEDIPRRNDQGELLYILHICIGNRKCVNPDHLYLGTPQDNVRDCIEQGRFHPELWKKKATEIVKERNKNRTKKFDDEQIREIRSLLEQGLTHKSIGERYGVSKSMVRDIKTGRSYADVI